MATKRRHGPIRGGSRPARATAADQRQTEGEDRSPTYAQGRGKRATRFAITVAVECLAPRVAQAVDAELRLLRQPEFGFGCDREGAPCCVVGGGLQLDLLIVFRAELVVSASQDQDHDCGGP